MEKLSRREKAMICVSIAGIGIAGYFGFKYFDKDKQFEIFKAKANCDREELDFIKFLVIESDCVPKALQNAENKLARKETKINALCDSLLKNPNDLEIKAAITKHEGEAAVLRKQIKKTFKLDELIKNDDNIYAK